MDADEKTLGLLLLCLGMGSVITMPLAGGLSARVGSRLVILCGGIGIVFALPILAMAASVPWLVFGLLLFGASLGAVDVAANIHGVEVQKAAGVPLMSNFHGMYSFGGLIGAGAMTLALFLGATPGYAASAAAAIIAGCLLVISPRLLRTRGGSDVPFFVTPRGVVLLIGVLTFSLFLVEGAMLDWSAVLLTDFWKMEEARAGIGYALFSLAMTIGRFSGDAVSQKLGGARVILIGALLAATGIGLTVFAPWLPLAWMGFVLIGFGAANLVPILFSVAGMQKEMPGDMAIAAVSVMGYAGILIGPALIGFVADGIGLAGAFMVLGLLTLFVASMYRIGRLF